MTKTSIQFNHKHSYEDLGLAITDIPEIPLANEKVEYVDIPGRVNGSLVIKDGSYEDVVIPVSFKISKKNYRDNINIFYMQEHIRNWLANVDDNRLLFSFIGYDKCFVVKHVKFGKLTRDLSRWGCFDVEFICEPFMYDYYDLNNFNITLNEPKRIYYQGTASGACCLKIYGSGNIQLTINNETVQINNVEEYVEIDSKLYICSNPNGTSKTKDMIGNFIELSPGLNDISWTGDVSRIDIKPRTAYK